MRILRIRHEVCDSDKEPVRTIYCVNTVHYVVRGHGYFGSRRLGTGEGFFCKYGSLAEYRPDPTDPWEYYWITFAPDDAQELPFILNTDADLCFLHSCNESIAALYNLSLAMNIAADSPLFSAAFLDIFRRLHSDSTAKLSSGANYALLARRMIDEGVENGMSPKIEDIANSLHINRYYLRNVFFKQFGISPVSYRQRVRLECAANLLRLTEHPIKQIAMRVGYDDALAFAKEFKRLYGISASEFRMMR